jgi:RNA polymerase sigma factor (sigma-70 family)
MYRVAARVLREVGIADRAEDAVQAAMVSLMKAPPVGVDNWEAVLVTTAKRRALDILDSAAIRHSGPKLGEEHDSADPDCYTDDIDEVLDRQRVVAQLREHLSLLNQQQRFVAWEYLARDRPRSDVAAELAVSPARISQIAKAAVLILRDAMGLKGGSE